MAVRLLLRWTDDKGASQERVLERGALTIGRSADNDIVLNSARVSRNHARIEITDDSATLNDPGSSNGTLVNDEKVSRATMMTGPLFDRFIGSGTPKAQPVAPGS